MRVLAIDPSTTFCGAAVCEDTPDMKMEVHETRLIRASQGFKGDEKTDAQFWGDRTVRIRRICAELNEICDRYQIDLICLEAPFHMQGKPGAHAALVEVSFGIKLLVAIPRKLPVESMEPLLVKSIFARRHMASKDDMRLALLEHTETGLITIKEDKEVSELSEHEVDSVAVALTYYSRE